MLQDPIRNAHYSEACSKHTPGAVCIQIMLLEHIWLRIFFKIIVQGHMVLEHMAQEHMSLIISRGQNLKKAAWTKCGSGEHCSWEMTRKIEEIILV